MTWTDDRFARIAQRISTESGLTFPDERRPYAEAAIRRAMSAARIADTATYAERLADGKLLQTLIGEVTVGETYFFRDPAQFEVLRNSVIPELIAHRAGTPLRFWSAGCASGEEAYSLAMLLEELGLEDRASIIGTDISYAALEKARRGLYGAWSFRTDTASWRERCFTERNAKWKVAARLRRRVDFAPFNLAKTAGCQQPLGIDVLFCRNVLMYFDNAALERAARVLADSLRPGGWLFTAPADPMLPAGADFEVISTPAGLLYRKISPARIADIHMPRSKPQEPAIVEPQPVAVPISAAPIHVCEPAGADAYKRALGQSQASAELYPLDPEPHVLCALLLLELGDFVAAAAAARRALYLDRTLAVAQLALGRALRLLGHRSAASRALHRAHDLLSRAPNDSEVRFAQNASAGNLAANAAAELALLQRSANART